MDISPNRTAIYADHAIYGFPSLRGQTSPSNYAALLGPGNQTFTITDPYTGLQPVTLVVPSPAQGFQYKYWLQVVAKARLVAQDASADQIAYPIKLMEYGNAQFGGNPILIDGSPLAPSFMNKSQSMHIGSSVSRIDIPAIEAAVAFDINQLTPNATFTPDPTSADWFLQVFVSISVKADFS